MLFLSQSSRPEEILPKRLEDFRKGIFTTSGILMGSFSSDGKLLFGIQLLNPNFKKHNDVLKRRKFNRKDILRLRYISEMLGCKAELELLKIQHRIKNDCYQSVYECMRLLLTQKNEK